MTERATFYEARAIAETRYLTKLLKDCGWNVRDAALAAGLNRTYLYSLILSLGIRIPYRHYRRPTGRSLEKPGSQPGV
jgi:transcriptional regulator of acetoin/glycerol metabolism